MFLVYGFLLGFSFFIFYVFITKVLIFIELFLKLNNIIT